MRRYDSGRCSVPPTTLPRRISAGTLVQAAVLRTSALPCRPRSMRKTPDAVPAWAPSAAFRDAVRSSALATLELYVGIVEAPRRRDDALTCSGKMKYWCEHPWRTKVRQCPRGSLREVRPPNRRALHRHRHGDRALPERQVDLHAATRAPCGDLERPPRDREARRLRGGRPHARRQHEEGASQAPPLTRRKPPADSPTPPF